MNWPKAEYFRFVSAPTDVMILGDGLAKKRVGQVQLQSIR